MNQSKEYIEYLIRKHFIDHNYTVGEYGDTVDTYLSLLNKCDIDKYILESILIPLLNNTKDFYIIGVGGDWNFIQIAFTDEDKVYIGNFYRGTFVNDIKLEYYKLVRDKTINNLIYEKI
jgi:hypothetical protein